MAILDDLIRQKEIVQEQTANRRKRRDELNEAKISCEAELMCSEDHLRWLIQIIKRAKAEIDAEASE